MRRLFPHAPNFAGVALLLVIACGVFLVSTPSPYAAPPSAPLRVHFIDVGQGASVFVQTPEGANMLIDGGEREAGEQVVVPYLRALGVKQLDMVMITHPHSDHIGGLVPAIEAFPVGTVLADGQVHTTKTYEHLLSEIARRGIPFRLARRGHSFPFKGIVVHILHPREPLLQDLNNNSLVVRLDHGQIRFLLTGDIEKEAESDLVSDPATRAMLKATVLQIPHHGSKTSTTKQFLSAVQPQVAVIQVGRENDYGHPHAVTLKSLASVKLLQTDRDGHILIQSDGARLTIRGGSDNAGQAGKAFAASKR